MKTFTVKAAGEWDMGPVVVRDGDVPVAMCRPIRVFGPSGGARSVTEKEAIENACLFSAAPELLEIVELLDADDEYKCGEEMREFIKAALLKAHGNVPA